MAKTPLPRKKSQSAIQPNGAWQMPQIFQGKYPTPSDEPCITVDTETTGMNPYRPMPGFKYPALPFCISWCCIPRMRPLEILEPSCILGAVDPQTRGVTFVHEELAAVVEILRAYPRWVFHNALFDLKMLLGLARHIKGALGKELTKLINRRLLDDAIEDTLGASHVLDSQENHGLKELCIKYLDMTDADQSILKATTIRAREVARISGIPVADDVKCDTWLPLHLNPGDTTLRTYAVSDAVRTAKLWIMHRAALVSEGLWPCYVRERRVMAATHRMQSNPVHLNPRILEIRDGYNTRRAQAEAVLQEAAGDPDFNPRSPTQLANLLHRTLGLPVLADRNKPTKQWPDGQPATDKSTFPDLCAYAEEQGNKWVLTVLESLAEYRKTNTAITYTDQYIGASLTRTVNGQTRIWMYGNFNPWGMDRRGMRTTRFSSSGPSLHNVGSPDEASEVDIRENFTPPPGKVWYSIDFNQLELRVMARLSNDRTLSRILNEGLDQHQITTDSINLLRCGLRYWPKVKHKDVLANWRKRVETTICNPKNLGPKGYDLSPISRKVGKAVNFAWTYGAGPDKLSLMAGVPAEDLRNAFADAYPGVINYMDDASNFARCHGYIKTLFGYRLFVNRKDSYKATNYSDQGTAGDILKNSMIAIWEYIDAKKLQERLTLLLCIHDEVILEADENLPLEHIVNLTALIGSAGDPIGCPTPAEVSIIRTHWGAKEKLVL